MAVCSMLGSIQQAEATAENPGAYREYIVVDDRLLDVSVQVSDRTVQENSFAVASHNE